MNLCIDCVFAMFGVAFVVVVVAVVVIVVVIVESRPIVVIVESRPMLSSPSAPSSSSSLHQDVHPCSHLGS